jgi:ElaB/YqjD/DUF883 family membrane-anchored ribosome-binding protein
MRIKAGLGRCRQADGDTILETAMTKPAIRQIRHDIEDTLEDIAKALHAVADELSDDAEAAVAQAAKSLREAAKALAAKTPPEARYVAEKALKEAKEHPVATTAAALSAAAALIALLRMGRKKKAG